MVYKIVKNWKSNDRDAHEITVYKYNYNHDEMVRYSREGDDLSIRTFNVFGIQYPKIQTFDLRNGEKKWFQYGVN